MKKTKFIWLIALVFVLACDGLSIKPTQVQGLRNQAQNAIEEGRYAYAAGKYRKAYAKDPDQVDLPYEIARLYAEIATKHKDAKTEQDLAIHWLYRARLVDDQFTLAKAKAKEFSVLQKNANYLSLIAALETNNGEPSGFIQRFMKRWDGVMSELQVLAQQMRGFFRILSKITHWVGFQVLVFVFLVFLFVVLFRQLGFAPGVLLWGFSFLLTSLGWHIGFRVISGGTEGGWDVIVKLLGFGLFFVLGLWVLKWLGMQLHYQIRKKWYGTSLHHRMSQKNYSTLREQLFEIEESGEAFFRKGHEALAHSKEDPNVLLDLEQLRKKLHQATQKPISGQD